MALSCTDLAFSSPFPGFLLLCIWKVLNSKSNGGLGFSCTYMYKWNMRSDCLRHIYWYLYVSQLLHVLFNAQECFGFCLSQWPPLQWQETQLRCIAMYLGWPLILYYGTRMTDPYRSIPHCLPHLSQGRPRGRRLMASPLPRMLGLGIGSVLLLLHSWMWLILVPISV